MASVQAVLDLWQACDQHRISFREIADLFSKHFSAGNLVSADDATVAKMIGHMEQVERVRRELLAVKPAASAQQRPMRQPVADETMEVESDRGDDDDNDQIDLSTDADRYPRPKGDEADDFDIHDNTIGYDRPDEDVEEENFPEPDDIAPVEPAPVRAQPLAAPPAETRRAEPIAPVTPPASAPVQPPAAPRAPVVRPTTPRPGLAAQPPAERRPAPQSVAPARPPSARLPRRRPPATSAAPAKTDQPPAHSQQLPREPAAEISPSSAGKGLKPRTDMGFFPTLIGEYDLSPEAIKNATWDKPVPMRISSETMSMPGREAAGPSPSAARTASPPAASAEAPPAKPHLKPIRRPAWLGVIAEEDPPDHL